MNAMSGFALRPQTSSDLLTLRDLTDEEVLKDAESDFRRCTTEAHFAAWAQKWGGACLSTLARATAEGCFE